ncbi:MAG: bifunctional nuclease family protein [Actinomycetota bacterium]|nr:bifunctional nuclease family protein [Actinomycetota bacterium]
MTVEMELVGVRVQMPTNAPILLLRETSGQRRTVPIYIGGPEAHAIDLALSGTPTARPMTHDLLTTLIDGLGCTVAQVVVTELRQGTFYAELSIKNAAGETKVFSARPSDAVAIAVRAQAPIFAEEALIEEAGIEEEPVEDEVEEEAMVEELRRFLDKANPDDFKS